MDDDAMLSYAEASAMTGVKVNTLYSMVARRQVPFTRIGPRLVRFPRLLLARWLAERLVLPVSSATSTRAAPPKLPCDGPRFR